MIRTRTRRVLRRFATASLNALLTFEVVAAAALAAMTSGAQLAGLETYDILSGSMEPSIHTGSLVYVRTGIACDRIQAGEVIAFDIGEDRTVTHRVLDVNTRDKTFTTKGDANALADPQAVPWNRVRGTVVAAIPKLGSDLDAFTARRAHFIVALIAGNALACIALQLLAEPRQSIKKGERPWKRPPAERI